MFREFFHIIKELNDAGIKYAVIGGIAMAFHEKPRFTRDIDLLIHPDELDKVKKTLSGLGYFESSPAWTFKNTNLTLCRFLKVIGEDEIMLDILLANTKAHKQIIENAVPDDSYVGEVRIAEKNDIIYLKRARNSEQDQIDIRSLEHDAD